MAGPSETFLFRVLVFLVKHPDFANRYFDKIPSDYFSHFPVLHRVRDALAFYRTKFGKNPDNETTLPDLVLSYPMESWSLPSVEEQEECWAFFETCTQDELGDMEWIEENLDRELRRLAAKAAISEGVELLQTEEFDEAALGEVRDKLEKALDFTSIEDLGVSLRDSLDARLLRREGFDTECIPTMLGKMDDHLNGGGIPLKSLCLVSARLGIGKSAALLHLVKAAAWTGKYSGLYVSLELSREMVEDRFDCSLTNTLTKNLKKSDAVLRDKYAQWKGNSDIVVIGQAPGTFSVNSLNWLLDKLKRERQFEPKIIAVDYADLMKMDYTRKNQPKWEALGELFIKLRAIAVERNLVVWTASQQNREGDAFSAGDTVAGSDEKLATADFGFTINLPADIRKGKGDTENPIRDVNLYICKSRFGPMFVTVPVTQDLSRMMFTTDGPTL